MDDAAKRQRKLEIARREAEFRDGTPAKRKATAEAEPDDLDNWAKSVNSAIRTNNAALDSIHERLDSLERWKGTPFVRVLFTAIAVVCIAPLATLFWFWLILLLFPSLLRLA